MGEPCRRRRPEFCETGTEEDPERTLLGILEWMKSLTSNSIIMCGHNSKVFDCVHFINALVLTKVDITEFHSFQVSSFFADTLPF